MSCSDCWEWLVELLVLRRSSNQDDPVPKATEPSSIKTVEPSSLSRKPDEVFRRDRMKQLFNRHGYNIAIFPGGHVKGVREAFNIHAVLELIPVEVGEVRIRGVETGIYLAMNIDGELRGGGVGEEEELVEESVFLESSTGPYLLYMSKKYSRLGWYIGITKTGEAKNGQKTWYPWGQKAILFVHRSPFMEHHPLKLLRNRHGITLAIHSNGKVLGSKENFTKESVLEFSPGHPPGSFRIHGVESNLYLAMDKDGRLYGEADRLDENNLFTEHAMDRYFIYLSVRWAHLGWHVGLKRSGKAKKGILTVYPSDQKAIQFEHIFPYQTAPTSKDLAALGEDFAPLAYIDEDD